MDGREQAVLAAKTDERLFNELVESHKSWMLRVASEATHRYITDSDDEWSVALMAFSEAVQGYEEEKGSFRGFAATVIRRRLVDYLRSEGRHADEVSVAPAAFEDGIDDEEAGGVELQTQRRMAEESGAAAANDTASRAREEIAELQGILRQYGFSFFDLADASPKAEKTKKSCAQAVRALIASVMLMAQMRLKRLLPIKELSETSGVIRKILERHRKYIIASAEILDGDFPILAGYLAYIKTA
ncbi:MAG: RNA polymerase subunit sigma [Oscillospiraceae bacterium]|nr:RNA polymerase subunit sigma [Oscillospiraceae bacterium]